jgi:hypothetical protein
VTTEAKRPGPSLWLSIAMMTIGVAIGVLSAIKVATPVVRTLLTSPTTAAPGRIQMHLGRGDYVVFEGDDPTGGPVTINASQVTVAAPNGAPVPVHDVDHTETITRGSQTFTAAVGFTAPARGTYDITFATNQRHRVVVARSIADTFHTVVGWIAAGAVAGLILVTGLVLLIVGIVRRGRRSGFGAPDRAVLPPPGWYPAPDEPGRLQYWDGAQWTEYRS